MNKKENRNIGGIFLFFGFVMLVISQNKEKLPFEYQSYIEPGWLMIIAFGIIIFGIATLISERRKK